MNLANFGFWILAGLWFLPACAGSKRESGDPLLANGEQGFSQEADNSGAVLDTRQDTQSLSSNPWTPYQVDAKKARKFASRLAAALPKSEKSKASNLAELLAAQRFANAPVDQMLHDLQRLAFSAKSGGLSKQDLGAARLQVAIAAIQQKRFSLAEFLLQDLSASSDAMLRANALNLKGFIALHDDRVPEAVEWWRQALKADDKNEAALLNLGFISLTYGRFSEAQTYLAQLGDGWFALSGLLVAKRLVGDSQDTSKICDKLLLSHPQHKPTVFNCGIHEWQSNNNLVKAKQLLKRALSIAGGPGEWDTQGYKILESIK